MLLSCALHNAREAVKFSIRRGSSSKSLRLRADYPSTLRSLTTTSVCWQPEEITPLRKQLKDEGKAKKTGAKQVKAQDVDPRLAAWELTVGIEIHAQLNTARKLFSCSFPGVRHMGVF